MEQREPDFFSRQILSARRFFRRPGEMDDAPVVVSGGLEFCSEDFYINRDAFPFVTLEYISSGKGKFIIKDREYQLEPGAVMFYGPEHRHTIATVPGAELHKYFLTVQPYAEAALSPLYGSVFFVSDSASILRSFEELVEFGNNPSPAATRLCSTIFEMLIQKCELMAVDYDAAKDLKYHSFLRCKSIIMREHGEIRSMREAAARCAVTEGYLCKLFSRYDYQTPYAFLQTLQMNAAAAMVMDTNRSIKEIASSFGYSDQGHFTRVFKRVFGTSPGNMRSPEK